MVSARSFLVPFKYSPKISYVLEFSHESIRVYTHGQPILVEDEENISLNSEDIQPTTVTAGSYICTSDMSVKSDIVSTTWHLVDEDETTVYSISSPYTYGDLWDDEELCFKLQTIQHSDVLYIFSERHPIKVLKRYGNTDWRLENLEIIGGPFEAMNSSDITITATATVGEVILTASDDLFASTDVGRLIRLRGYDDNAKVWTASVTVNSGDIFVSDNKYYQALNNGTSGTKKPVHGQGIRSDGSIRWKYLHDGTGVVKITAFTDAEHVTAEATGVLPLAVLSGTVYWELGLLHSGVNYPKSGAFFRNRFAFLVNTSSGPKVCLSMVGDYNNFSDMEYGETTAESAITVPVVSTEFNEGKWLFAGDVLFVGTGTAEFYIDVISSASALSNDNIKILRISAVGSKAIVPVGVGAHIFFTDRYGLSLRDLSYDYYNDGYDQIDISLLGKHLFSSRIVAMSYQETPDKILWCLTGCGHLVALTFSAEQEVAALSQHDFSGTVESLAVIPNLDDCSDQVWLEVKRMINQQVVRTIEFMENGMPLAWPAYIYNHDNFADKEQAENEYVRLQARYLDGAVLFVRGNNGSGTEISGLTHLEGETVMVFADGALRGEALVMNGKVNIKATDNIVLVGKKIASQYIPQAIYIDNENGSGIGQRQRVNHVLLMMYYSGGGKIGEDENNLSDILYRNSDAKMGEAQELFSGNKEILFDGSTNLKGEAATILIENSSPLPMNILALVLYVE